MDVSSCDQQQQQQQEQMFPSKPIESDIQQQNQEQQHRILESDHLFSTNFNNNYTEKISCHGRADTSDVKTILQQPISNLRCNRRRSSTRYQSLSNDNTCSQQQQQQQQHSDILDYIDKIPINDLERGLFDKQTVSNTTDSAGQFQSSSQHHQYHPRHNQFHQNITTTLEKPTVYSPSPTKMYRMSMF